MNIDGQHARIGSEPTRSAGGSVLLLEELHTACELLLEELMNRRSKKLSFAELVGAAEKAGHLDPDASVLLTELKDLPKNVRHRAAEGARSWLDEHWEGVALLIERLVQRVRAT